MRSYRACGTGAALLALGVFGCSRSSLDDGLLLGGAEAWTSGGSRGGDGEPVVPGVAGAAPSAQPSVGPIIATGGTPAMPTTMVPTMMVPSANPIPTNAVPGAAGAPAAAPTVVNDEPPIGLPSEPTGPDPTNPPCSAAAGDPPGVSPYWGIYGLQDTYAVTDGESTLCVQTRRGNGFCMWGTTAAHGDAYTNWGGLLGLQFARMTAAGELVEPLDATAVAARGVHLVVDELEGLELRPMIIQADMPGEGTNFAESPFVLDIAGADHEISSPGDYYVELSSARQSEWSLGVVDADASLDTSRVHSLQLQVVSGAEPTDFSACFSTVEFFDQTLSAVPALRPPPQAESYTFDIPEVKLGAPVGIEVVDLGAQGFQLTDLSIVQGTVYVVASRSADTSLFRLQEMVASPAIATPTLAPVKLWSDAEYLYLGAADDVYSYNTLDGTFEATGLPAELLPVRDIGGVGGEGWGIATPTTSIFLPFVDGGLGLLGDGAATEPTTRVFGGQVGLWEITELSGQLLRLDGYEWPVEPYGKGFKFGAASLSRWAAATDTAVVGELRGNVVDSIQLIDPMFSAVTLGPIAVTDAQDTFVVSLAGEYVFHRYPGGGWEVWPRDPINPGAVVSEIAADDNYVYLLTSSYLERIMIPRYDYLPAWADDEHPRTSQF